MDSQQYKQWRQRMAEYRARYASPGDSVSTGREPPISIRASQRIAQVAEDLDRKDWTNLGGTPERVLLTAILRFLDEVDERIQALEHAEKLRAEVARIEDITRDGWPVASDPKRPTKRWLTVKLDMEPPRGASLNPPPPLRGGNGQA